MGREAFTFERQLRAEAAQELRVDRHYLLCCARGALRLEADGTTWILPPARAALVEAYRPISVTVTQPSTTSSVLFHTDVVPAPPSAVVVFDLTPLARRLLEEVSGTGDVDEPLEPYARAMFDALAAHIWQLAESPSPVRMPTGRSPEVRLALEHTVERLADAPTAEAVAASVGLTSRSLARRFEDELGMTWRAALRRLRVLRAIELLSASDASVTAITHQVGYGSLSAFNAAFRDLTGRTPTEYRAGFRPCS